MLLSLRDLLWLAAWRAWVFARTASGDDAYDRYRAAMSAEDTNAIPLSRAQFFRQHVEQKWNRYLQIGR